MTRAIYSFIVLFTMFATTVFAQDIALKRVHIDEAGNVHVTTSTGKERLLTNKGRSTRVELSKDKRTAAWLIKNTWTAEGDGGPGTSALVVYRDGKFQRIECLPFIRDYWFWNDGENVGIDCGGRHFAGTLTLYDVRTGKVIDSFFSSGIPDEKCPAWSVNH